ncbi:MAG: hypothetical protein DDT23_00562 [candidate division WS2 bacterium]|nr:hypothetical protein [Candidatus Lithacetigena glycinireducens]
MKDNAYYFPHDYNARNDPKILQLRLRLGNEGYGIYWQLIEILHEQGGKIQLDEIEGVAFSLNVELEKLNNIITILYQLKLLNKDDNSIWNDRVLNNLKERKEKRLARSRAGKKGMTTRWKYQCYNNVMKKDNNVITKDDDEHNNVITKDDDVITKYNKGKESKGKKSKGKESKEEEEEEEVKEIKTSFVPTQIEFGLSKLLLDKIIERKPDYKKPDLQKWARHIDLMIRIDKRDPEKIRQIIEWCQADDFWQNVILSTEKLRKQYDKIDLQMRSGREYEREEWKKKFLEEEEDD